MANLIKKRSEQPATPSAGWDPYEMMRSILRWDPFREMTARGGALWTPSFEVKETKDAYVFTADLPGVKESDLDISVTGNRLTVGGKREEEEREEGETFYAYERTYGTFTRSFTLPEGADAENVRADLKDGVLKLVLAKKPEVQPKRIQIKAGEAKAKG